MDIFFKKINCMKKDLLFVDEIPPNATPIYPMSPDVDHLPSSDSDMSSPAAKGLPVAASPALAASMAVVMQLPLRGSICPSQVVAGRSGVPLNGGAAC
jgi:hypothetical protein